MQCPHLKLVKELVGVNFKKFAYDSGKHCLVLFYDAWDEDYETKQKLVYEELAEFYRHSHSDVVGIYRIEFEPYDHFLKGEKINSLPLVRLYRKGRNRVITFDGALQFETLKNWLEEKIAEIDPPNDEL